jgi:hypothetical protein
LADPYQPLLQHPDNLLDARLSAGDDLDAVMSAIVDYRQEFDRRARPRKRNIIGNFSPALADTLALESDR